MSYAELLKDPRWQRKRLEILEAAGWKCERCGDSTSSLQVHHRWYSRGAKPWEYERELLAALCENCHEAVTKNHRLLDSYVNGIKYYCDAEEILRVVSYIDSLLFLKKCRNYDRVIPMCEADFCEGRPVIQGIADAFGITTEVVHSFLRDDGLHLADIPAVKK